MMTRLGMIEILEDVTYKDWKFRVEERGDHLFLQVVFDEVDFVDGQVREQHGRKWILSKHMTRSEVVLSAFKAIMTAEEHEIREKFRYKKRMILGPHIDVEALWSVARQVEVREDPSTIARD